MKTLMILGASILQLPAILKAKEMGIEVIAVDMDKQAIGFKNADICLEISTIDIPNVIKAASEYRIDGVMTLASDMPMRTVAAVASELNIIGISKETALKATNKALMRQCLKENGVSIPRFFCVTDYDEYISASHKLGAKFIVKPADNSGSRGVFLIENREDVCYAYEYSRKHSRNGEIVLEEFMEGPEVSVETVSVGGRVHIVAITDKLTTGSPRFVEMGHAQPSRFSETIKAQIEAVATAAVKAIGIETGPSHTEIIVTSAGPKIVELGARLGGDNITTHLTPLSTGVDMVESCIKIALGNKPDLQRKINKGSAIRYFKVPAGKITDIRGIEDAQRLAGIKQISFVKTIGDTVGEINCSSDRIGFVIAQADSANNAIHVCEEAIRKINVIVE